MRSSHAAFLIIGLGLAALPWACSSNGSPTNPNNPTTPQPTSTFTATVTATPIPGISWFTASVGANGSDGPNGFAEVYLALNGQPVTNAAAILSGPALSNPVTLPYNSPVTNFGSVFSYYYAGSINYQSGQPYTITTIAGGVTAFAAVTAVGGVFTYAPDGSAVSWTVNGNSQIVSTLQTSPSQFTYNNTGGGGISPASIPVSAYATPGFYRLDTFVYGLTSNLTGGTLTRPSGISSQDYFNVTFYLGPTFTPTFSPTDSSTPTDTGTPTSTRTFTFTPTPTFTLTPTLSFTPTATFTFTQTFTSTGTPTFTPTPTNTFTSTSTPTPNPCAYVGDTYAWPSYFYGNIMNLRQYSAPVTATVLTALSTYLYTGSGTTDHYEMAVYTGTNITIVSMVPGTDTGVKTFDGNPGTGTSGWQTVTLSPPVTLTGGTPYWFGLTTDGNGTAISGGGSEPFGSIDPVTLGALPSNPSPLDTTANSPGIWQMSIYGTFCP